MDSSKRSVDPLELCVKAVRFPGTVHSFQQILRESLDPFQMLEAIRQGKTLKLIRTAIWNNYFLQ